VRERDSIPIAAAVRSLNHILQNIHQYRITHVFKLSSITPV